MTVSETQLFKREPVNKENDRIDRFIESASKLLKEAYAEAGIDPSDIEEHKKMRFWEKHEF